MLTDAILNAEDDRRKRCVSRLRRSDMGEAVTNKLMEQLSDDPSLLEAAAPMSDDSQPDSAKSFEIREVNQRGSVFLETRIAGLEMSDIMAARLRSLYVRLHDFNLLTPEYLAQFARHVFLLLFRYSYVDPGFKRQGYLAPRYFEAISNAFDRPIDLECFSAAFNTTVPHYCSLFPDVESPFGSIGSFFDLEHLGDYWLLQVSPPRIGLITKQAVEHCMKLLSRLGPDEPGHFLVVLTPFIWSDISEIIDNSGYCVWHNRTKRGDLIEYRDVVRNAPTRYPMPRVSILSNADGLPGGQEGQTSKTLHAAFSVSR